MMLLALISKLLVAAVCIIFCRYTLSPKYGRASLAVRGDAPRAPCDRSPHTAPALICVRPACNSPATTFFFARAPAACRHARDGGVALVRRDVGRAARQAALPSGDPVHLPQPERPARARKPAAPRPDRAQHGQGWRRGRARRKAARRARQRRRQKSAGRDDARRPARGAALSKRPARRRRLAQQAGGRRGPFPWLPRAWLCRLRPRRHQSHRPLPLPAARGAQDAAHARALRRACRAALLQRAARLPHVPRCAPRLGVRLLALARQGTLAVGHRPSRSRHDGNLARPGARAALCRLVRFRRMGRAGGRLHPAAPRRWRDRGGCVCVAQARVHGSQRRGSG
eukprot:6117716-Prymnesium_polylepis.1